MDKVRFQQQAQAQGVLFRNVCITALEMAGFDIVKLEYNVPEVGITLDALVNGRAGQAYAFEFKGSWNVKRPGLQRTDTAKKAIANGALFNCSIESEIIPPMLVLTTHMPEAGDGLRMIQTAIRRGILLDVLLASEGRRLEWYSDATAEDVELRLRWSGA